MEKPVKQINIYIIRNGQRYGPYNDFSLQTYVNSGQILLHDKAIASEDSIEHTVNYYLKKAGLKYKIPIKVKFKNIWCRLKSNFPKVALFLESLLNNRKRRIILLVIICCMIVGPLRIILLIIIASLAIIYSYYAVVLLINAWPRLIEQIKKLKEKKL